MFIYYLFPNILKYKIKNSVDFCYFTEPFCDKNF